MSRVPAWFDRKFEFSFPIEQWPNVLVRLRGTPARLEEMLGGMPHEVLVRKRTEKWSAQEHAGHLLDLEPLWLARVKDFLSDGETLTPADLTNRRTYEANYNAQLAAAVFTGFRGARLRLLNQIDKLQPATFSNTLLHPRLKQPMRLIDHLFFVAEHDDHHLAKIWELIHS